MSVPEGFETMREDLAFLRTIVLDAGRAGVGDGFGLIAAGACYGAAGVGAFVASSRPMHGLSVAAIFSWATFALVALQLLRRWRHGPSNAPTPIARFANATRWGLGLAIVTVAIAFALAGALNGALLLPFLSVVVFAIYGAVWVAIAAATSMLLPRVVAGCSYATALILAGLAGSPWQFLGFGIAMIALAFLPGLWIRRQAQR